MPPPKDRIAWVAENTGGAFGSEGTFACHWELRRWPEEATADVMDGEATDAEGLLGHGFDAAPLDEALAWARASAARVSLRLADGRLFSADEVRKPSLPEWPAQD